MKQLLFIFGIFFIATSPAFAESGPLGFGEAEFTQGMETDRPDFTEGTQTVQAGHLQVELGYSFTYENSPKLEEHGIPEALLRVGLLDTTELRIAWGGYRRIEEDTTTTEGTDDLSVGVKYRLSEETDTIPALSLIAELSAPVGSRELRGDDTVPAIKILWAKGIDDLSSIAGNINFVVDLDGNDRFLQSEASLAYGYSVSDLVGTYLEYFGLFPSSDAPSSKASHFLNGGFTYALSDSLQADILAGFGLNDTAEDFFTGLGFSFRI